MTSVASSLGVKTLAMQSVPDELRGRVFGSLNATCGLLSPAVAAVAGLTAEIIGIVPTLNVGTALIALSGVRVLRAYARTSSFETPTRGTSSPRGPDRHRRRDNVTLMIRVGQVP